MPMLLAPTSVAGGSVSLAAEQQQLQQSVATEPQTVLVGRQF